MTVARTPTTKKHSPSQVFPSLKMDLRFFPARAADLHALARLEKMSAKEDYLSLRELQRLHSEPRCLVVLAKSSDLSDTSLAEAAEKKVDDLPLGYIILQVRAEDVLVPAWNVFLQDLLEEVGGALVRKCLNLPDTHSEYRRPVTTVCVRESGLGEQLFWRSCGFLCEKIVRKVYDCPPEDGYLFRHRRG